MTMYSPQKEKEIRKGFIYVIKPVSINTFKMNNPGCEKQEQDDYKNSNLPVAGTRKSIYPRECPECRKIYKNRASFSKHVLQQHKEGSKFICDKCGASIKTKAHLFRHMKTHLTTKKKSKSKAKSDKHRRNCYFVDCDETFYKVSHLYDHLIKDHGADYTIETKTFNNMEEFEKWKEEEDVKNYTNMYLSHGEIRRKNKIYRTYVCNFHNKEQKPVQGKQRKAERKPAYNCPARMLLTESPDSIEVKYYSEHNHICHPSNLQHVHQLKSVRREIQRQINEGVSVKSIEENMRGYYNKREFYVQDETMHQKPNSRKIDIQNHYRNVKKREERDRSKILYNKLKKAVKDLNDQLQSEDKIGVIPDDQLQQFLELTEVVQASLRSSGMESTKEIEQLQPTDQDLSPSSGIKKELKKPVRKRKRFKPDDHVYLKWPKEPRVMMKMGQKLDDSMLDVNFKILGLNLNIFDFKSLEENIAFEDMEKLISLDERFREGFLTARVIDAYLELLSLHSSEIKKVFPLSNEDFDSPDTKRVLPAGWDSRDARLLIPVNVGGCHWILIVYTYWTNSYKILDPMEDIEDCEHLGTLCYLHKVLFLGEETTSEFMVEGSVPRAFQQDGVSCGVFVCFYAKQLANNGSLEFPVDTSMFRKEIYTELMENRWNDELEK